MKNKHFIIFPIDYNGKLGRPDLSPRSNLKKKIRDIQLIATDHMRHFCKFQLHRFDTVDMTDNQFFSEVGSLDLTW